MDIITHETFDLSAVTTLDAMARAIFLPAAYESYRTECDRFTQGEPKVNADRWLANLAMNHARFNWMERNSYPLGQPVFEHAHELALHFERLCGLEGVDFLADMDEPFMMWSSPWQCQTHEPYDYAFMAAVYSLHNDECSFTVNSEFGSIDEQPITDFLKFLLSSGHSDIQNVLGEIHRNFRGFDTVSETDEVLLPFLQPLVEAWSVEIGTTWPEFVAKERAEEEARRLEWLAGRESIAA